MATISKIDYYLPNVGSIKKVVTYSGGYFRIKLPDIIIKDLCITNKKEQEVIGNSEQDVNDKFTSKVHEWTQLIAIEEKVILFKAKVQGAYLKEENWENWNDGKYKPYYMPGTNNRPEQKIWHFCKEDINIFDDTSLGLTLIWAVYKKINVNGKIDYKFISGRAFDSRCFRRDDKEFTEIPYTEERELFFSNLDEQFAKMIKKVNDALGDLTPEKLIAIADSGIRMLN